MGLNSRAFIIHDVTRFPFVVFNDDAAQAPASDSGKATCPVQSLL